MSEPAVPVTRPASTPGRSAFRAVRRTGERRWRPGCNSAYRRACYAPPECQWLPMVWTRLRSGAGRLRITWKATVYTSPKLAGSGRNCARQRRKVRSTTYWKFVTERFFTLYLIGNFNYYKWIDNFCVKPNSVYSYYQFKFIYILLRLLIQVRVSKESFDFNI